MSSSFSLKIYFAASIHPGFFKMLGTIICIYPYMDQILLRTPGNPGKVKATEVLMRYGVFWEKKKTKNTELLIYLYPALSFKAQYRKIQTYKIGKWHLKCWYTYLFIIETSPVGLNSLTHKNWFLKQLIGNISNPLRYFDCMPLYLTSTFPQKKAPIPLCRSIWGYRSFGFLNPTTLSLRAICKLKGQIKIAFFQIVYGILKAYVEYILAISYPLLWVLSILLL